MPAYRRRTAVGAAVVAVGLGGSIALGGSSASADDKPDPLLGGLLTPITQTVTGVTDSLLGTTKRAHPVQSQHKPKAKTAKPATTRPAQQKTRQKTAAEPKQTQRSKSQPAVASAKNNSGLLPGLIGAVTTTVDSTVGTVTGTVDKVVKTVPKVVQVVDTTVNTLTTKTVPGLVNTTVRTVGTLLNGGGVATPPGDNPGPGSGSTGSRPDGSGTSGTGSTPTVPTDGGLIPTLPLGDGPDVGTGDSALQPESAGLIGVAPLDSTARPDLGPDAGRSATHDDARAVSYPAGLSALPAATTVLVGIMLAFMIGVIAVVVIAGHRGRSAVRSTV